MMNLSIAKILSATALCAVLAGCASEDPALEGISINGGNAIAHNSALQIVNPWPTNVHETNLVTPAETAVPTAPGTTAVPAVTANTPE